MRHADGMPMWYLWLARRQDVSALALNSRRVRFPGFTAWRCRVRFRNPIAPSTCDKIMSSIGRMKSFKIDSSIYVGEDADAKDVEPLPWDIGGGGCTIDLCRYKSFGCEAMLLILVYLHMSLIDVKFFCGLDVLEDKISVHNSINE